MKKLLVALTAFAAISANAGTLTVGATPVPHAEILAFVKPALEKEGVELKIKEFTDYVQPNLQLARKGIDANFFQHQPYLDEFATSRKLALVSVAGVHIEPIGIYANQLKSLDDLKEGATIIIPNDVTNGGRALLLLDKAGVIKLKADAGIAAKVKDIVENPKKVVIREFEAPMIPRAFKQADLALINTNYALDAGLNPTKDALFIEGADSPYVNILVTREDNKDSEDVQKLIKVLHSEEVKNFINEKYQGAILPAFN